MSSCVALHTLLVSNNQLIEFPTCIPHLLNLKVLDISHNELQTTRPTYFSTLLKLTELNLSHNKIDCIPNSLYMLNKLTRLILSHNEITSLSEELIAKLTSLQYFDVSFNKIQTIPSDICHLVNLIELNLRNNQLKVLPDSLSAMSQLKVIYLMDNLFKEFPTILHKMKNLKNWNLNNNQISGFYAEFIHNLQEEQREDEIDQDREDLEHVSIESSDRNLPLVPTLETIKRKNGKLFVELENEIFRQNLAGNQLIITQSLTEYGGWSKLRNFYTDLMESMLYIQEMDYKPLLSLSSNNLNSCDNGEGWRTFWRTIFQNSKSTEAFKRSPSTETLSSVLFSDHVVDTLNIGKDYVKFVRKYNKLVEKLHQYNRENRADQILLSKSGQAKIFAAAINLNTSMNQIGNSDPSKSNEYEIEMDRQVDKLLQESKARKTTFRLTLSGNAMGGDMHQQLQDLRDKYKSRKDEDSIEEVSQESENQGVENSTNANPHNDELQTDSNQIRPNTEQGQNSLQNTKAEISELPQISPKHSSHSDKPLTSPRNSVHSEKHTVRKSSKYSWKFSALLFDPYVGNPNNSQLYYQVIEAYYGLSLALIEMGECLSSDIRKIERCRNLQSKLNLNHRRGIDMMDLMPGYDHFFPRGDQLENQTNQHNEEIVEANDKKKPFSTSGFFSMSDIDLGNDLESTENSRPSTTEGGRPLTQQNSRPTTMQNLSSRNLTSESKRESTTGIPCLLSKLT